MRLLIVSVLTLMSLAMPARAEFIISSAIVEFTSEGSMQKDIDIISRSDDTQYLDVQVDELKNAGLPNEVRTTITDPTKSALLVTPGKTVLGGGDRKTLRFVLLKKPDAQEHIYRVAIKPVIKGVDNESQVGLKVLVGYEVLVIVRPATISPSYDATRSGTKLMVKNTGNTNILFENGQQCPAEAKCPLPPVLRAYPGETTTLDLPKDAPVTYNIWDGINHSEKSF